MEQPHLPSLHVWKQSGAAFRGCLTWAELTQNTYTCSKSYLLHRLHFTTQQSKAGLRGLNFCSVKDPVCNAIMWTFDLWSMSQMLWDWKIQSGRDRGIKGETGWGRWSRKRNPEGGQWESTWAFPHLIEKTATACSALSVKNGICVLLLLGKL